MSIENTYIDELPGVAHDDVIQIRKKDAAYGGSWKKRGGIGAYMMMCRKIDRLEQSVLPHGYDIFKAIEEDKREESVLDDIRDLRRYLLLIEAEIQARNATKRNERAVDNFHIGSSRWSGEFAQPIIPNTTHTTLSPQSYTVSCPCGDDNRPGHPVESWCVRESLGDA